MEGSTSVPKNISAIHLNYVFVIVIVILIAISGSYWMYLELRTDKEALATAQTELAQAKISAEQATAKLSAALLQVRNLETENQLLAERNTTLENNTRLAEVVSPTPGAAAKPVTPAEPTLAFVSPRSSDRLCLNESHLIEWSAPTNMRSVEIIIGRAGAAPIYSLTIGSFPATYNEANTPGVGRFTWKVGDVISQYGQTTVVNPITPGPAYEMVIKGIVDNTSVVGISDLFSIVDCRE